MTYTPNASHNLTYPSSGKSPSDTRWFDVREVGQDYGKSQLERLIEYYEQMAVICREDRASNLSRRGPKDAPAFERAAEAARAELHAWQASKGEAA